MELPIPKYLSDLITPIGEENDEFNVTAKLKCKCGNENLELKLVGDDSNYKKDQVIQVTEINNGFF